MVLFLLPLLVGCTVLLGVVGIHQLRSEGQRVTARLRDIREGAAHSEAGPQYADFMGEDLPAWVKPVGLFGWVLPGAATSDSVRWELAQTGYRHPDAGRIYAGARVLSTLAMGTLTLLVTGILQLTSNESLGLTIAFALLGYMLPAMVIRLKRSRRQEELTLALPDALDLLVICVEAGQGLNAALMHVTRETKMHASALAEELSIVNQEMRAGIVRPQALRNLALRTGIDDIRSLVAVLVQNDKLGSSIAQALRTHAESLRTRRRQRAEERARKTPVKMVFPLVFCIFPELLVVILAPGMIGLFRALK